MINLIIMVGFCQKSNRLIKETLSPESLCISNHFYTASKQNILLCRRIFSNLPSISIGQQYTCILI